VADDRLKPSPSDYHRWAFRRVQKTEGSESNAFAYIMTRWLSQDKEEAKDEFGITRKAFEQETDGNLRRMEPGSKQPKKPGG
jgi:hypothetical protein